MSTTVATSRRHHGKAKRLLLTGVLAGVLGGTLMMLWLIAFSSAARTGPLFPLQLIAATFFRIESLLGGPVVVLVGLLIHYAVAVGFGLLYASLVDTETTTGTALLGAMVYALALYLIMTFLVLPAVDPIMRQRVDLELAAWLAGHLFYGLGLGLTPALSRLLTGPRRPKRRPLTPLPQA